MINLPHRPSAPYRKPLVQSKLQELSYEIKKINLTLYFNSSIERIGNSYIVVGRKLDSTRGKIGGNKVHVLYLDKDFNVISSRDLGLNKNLEDPRIIKYQNEYIIISTYQTYGGRGHMTFTKFREGSTPKTFDINYKPTRREKNWSPFVFENRFFLVYSIFPHVVLELDLNNGNIVNKFESNIMFPWVGIPRGGTPAIKFNNYYISFFHSSTVVKGRKKYLMGAYAFENKTPFKIIGYTDSLEIKEPDFYEKNIMNRHEVIFPCGLLDEKGKFIVSCGVNDTYTKILSFGHRYILSRFKWINSI